MAISTTLKIETKKIEKCIILFSRRWRSNILIKARENIWNIWIIDQE